MARLVYVAQEFDLALYGAVDIGWTDDTGARSISDISTGIYRHATSAADFLTHPSSTLMSTTTIANTTRPSFGATLQALMDAATAQTPTVTYSNDTNRYTLACNGAVFSVTWSGAAQLLMRKLLGFTGNLSGATSYTATAAPFFTLEPRKNAFTEPKALAAVTEAVSRRRTSGGSLTRMGPVVLPHGVSWRFEQEADSATLDEFAVSPGYTWQSFFNDSARHGRRCYFVDYGPPVGSTQRWVFQLMSDGFDSGTHRRTVANLRDRWTIDVEANVIGRY